MTPKKRPAPVEDRGIIEIIDERDRETFVADNAVIDNTSLSVFVKMTYLVLVRHLDCSRNYPPSTDLMAAQAGISERQVLQSIRELEARCMIAVLRRPGAPSRIQLLDKSLWRAGGLADRRRLAQRSAGRRHIRPLV